MIPGSDDDYLERVKSEIRAEADLARVRTPVARRAQPAEPERAAVVDGIDRDRLDYTIGELTGAHYIEFLNVAFRALLKRPPDDTGSLMQVRLLAAGASKAEILGNLRWSPEGRRVGVRVRGLLPRYVLAKFGRVPVFGHAINWCIALAGLPVLMRHQRAVDTQVAATFVSVADAQIASAASAMDERSAYAGRLHDLESRVNERSAHFDKRLDLIVDDIRRALLRLDDLERRALELESRATGLEHGHSESGRQMEEQRAFASKIYARALEQGNAEGSRKMVEQVAIALESRANALELVHANITREMGELRHNVLSTNHWVVSLQRSLATLDATARVQRTHADQLAAAIDHPARQVKQRGARYQAWAGELAKQLPAASIVLDLGSGDGVWTDALRVCGVTVRGVEANSVWVSRAQARGLPVALGDPQDALARCPDASLGGLVVSASIPTNEFAIAQLMSEAQRTLRPGGCVLLRLEHDAPRMANRPTVDAAQWTAILRAAGFTAIGELPGTGATALLARRA